MYGFGDDRNPANDSVNVMEEILIEYIVDVVCLSISPSMSTVSPYSFIVSDSSRPREKGSPVN